MAQSGAMVQTPVRPWSVPTTAAVIVPPAYVSLEYKSPVRFRSGTPWTVGLSHGPPEVTDSVVGVDPSPGTYSRERCCPSPGCR